MHVHLDERSAAFFALGIASATDAPVAIACTSGTAATEYLPAIVEASQSRRRLVALTADRPPRLRGTGANQTIDHTELYGRYARAYLEPPVPGGDGDAASWFDTGLRALTDATRPPAGPVHVNCCFEEPTVPDGEATWSRREAPAVPEVEHDPDAIGAALDSFVASYAGRRGVITIGALRPPQTLSLLSLGALLGWPVLAEPLSGLRLDASDAAARWRRDSCCSATTPGSPGTVPRSCCRSARRRRPARANDSWRRPRARGPGCDHLDPIRTGWPSGGSPSTRSVGRAGLGPA